MLKGNSSGLALSPDLKEERYKNFDRSFTLQREHGNEVQNYASSRELPEPPAADEQAFPMATKCSSCGSFGSTRKLHAMLALLTTIVVLLLAGCVVVLVLLCKNGPSKTEKLPENSQETTATKSRDPPGSLPMHTSLTSTPPTSKGSRGTLPAAAVWCPSPDIIHKIPETIYSPGYNNTFDVDVMLKCKYTIVGTFEDLVTARFSLPLPDNFHATLTVFERTPAGEMRPIGKIPNDINRTKFTTLTSHIMVFWFEGYASATFLAEWEILQVRDHLVTPSDRCPNDSLVHSNAYPENIVLSPGYPGFFNATDPFNCNYHLLVNGSNFPLCVEVMFSFPELLDSAVGDRLWIYDGWGTETLLGTMPNKEGQRLFRTTKSNTMLVKFEGHSTGIFTFVYYSLSCQSTGSGPTSTPSPTSSTDAPTEMVIDKDAELYSPGFTATDNQVAFFTYWFVAPSPNNYWNVTFERIMIGELDYFMIGENYPAFTWDWRRVNGTDEGKSFGMPAYGILRFMPAPGQRAREYKITVQLVNAL